MKRVPGGLRVVLFTNILVLVAGAMFVPMYAVYVERIGGDLLDAGLAASLFAVAAGVTSLVAGSFADRIKRKAKLVALCYLLIGGGFLMYILVQNVWQLFVLQIVIGLLQASYEPVFDGLYTKHIGNPKKASSRWSFWEAGNYFSLAIGAGAGALVVTATNFATLFAIMAGLCVLSGLYVLRVSSRL